MGVISQKVDREDIKAGHHIYTWRAVFTYSHHGIYVGGSKVVHFTPDRNLNQNQYKEEEEEEEEKEEKDTADIPTCPTFPDCGFRQPGSGVILTCLDCFLRNGSLYLFQYGVTPSLFLSKLRAGTCTTAPSDPHQSVIHRAMYLLQNGFGNYHAFQNNCEDFALYCKTGLLIIDRLGVGTSGQASSFLGAPLAALLSSPLKLLMPNPIGLATITAGMYCISRYATDIGVRTDVIKVPVEDLAVNLGWGEGDSTVLQQEEIIPDDEASASTSSTALITL